MVEKAPIYNAPNGAKAIQHIGSIYGENVLDDITVPKQESRVIQSGVAFKGDTANKTYCSLKGAGTGLQFNNLPFGSIAGEHSIMIAFKTNADITSYQPIAGCMSGSFITNYGYGFHIYNSKLRFHHSTNNTDWHTNLAADVVANSYYIAVVTFDKTVPGVSTVNTTGKLFLSGIKEVEHLGTSHGYNYYFAINGSQPSPIGGVSNGGYNNEVSEFKFYDVELSEADAILLSSNKKIETEPIIHLTFIETEENVVFNVIGDSSYNGIITNLQSDTWVEDSSVPYSYANEIGYSKIYPCKAKSNQDLLDAFSTGTYDATEDAIYIETTSNAASFDTGLATSVNYWNNFRILNEGVVKTTMTIKLVCANTNDKWHTIRHTLQGDLTQKDGFIPVGEWVTITHLGTGPLTGSGGNVSTYIRNGAVGNVIAIGDRLYIKDVIIERLGIIPTVEDNTVIDALGLTWADLSTNLQPIAEYNAYKGKCQYTPSFTNIPYFKTDRDNAIKIDSKSHTGYTPSDYNKTEISILVRPTEMTAWQSFFSFQGGSIALYQGNVWIYHNSATGENKGNDGGIVLNEWNEIKVVSTTTDNMALNTGIITQTWYINGVQVSYKETGDINFVSNNNVLNVAILLKIGGSSAGDIGVNMGIKGLKGVLLNTDSSLVNNLYYYPIEEGKGSNIYDVYNSNILSVSNYVETVWNNTQDVYSRNALKGYNNLHNVYVNQDYTAGIGTAYSTNANNSISHDAVNGYCKVEIINADSYIYFFPDSGNYQGYSKWKYRFRLVGDSGTVTFRAGNGGSDTIDLTADDGMWVEGVWNTTTSPSSTTVWRFQTGTLLLGTILEVDYICISGQGNVPVKSSNVYEDVLDNAASHSNPGGRKLLEGIDLKLNPNGAPALTQAGIDSSVVVNSEYVNPTNLLSLDNRERDIVLYDKEQDSLSVNYWDDFSFRKNSQIRINHSLATRNRIEFPIYNLPSNIDYTIYIDFTIETLDANARVTFGNGLTGSSGPSSRDLISHRSSDWVIAINGTNRVFINDTTPVVGRNRFVMTKNSNIYTFYNNNSLSSVTYDDSGVPLDLDLAVIGGTDISAVGMEGVLNEFVVIPTLGANATNVNEITALGIDIEDSIGEAAIRFFGTKNYDRTKMKNYGSEQIEGTIIGATSTEAETWVQKNN